MPTPRPSTSARTSSERAASCSNRFYRRRRVELISFRPLIPCHCRTAVGRSTTSPTATATPLTRWSGFRILIERQFITAYQRGEVDNEQLASALRRYDGLDANKKGTADELLSETGASGVKLLAKMDDDGFRRVLDFDIKRADEFRAAAARNLEEGYATTDDIDKLPRRR